MTLHSPPRFILAFVAGLALVTSIAVGQLQINEPNFDIDVMASGLSADAASMAADRFGNVYILDAGNFGGPVVTPPTVTQIRPDGSVVPNYFTGFGLGSQLATNPLNGFVYMCSRNPILTVLQSTVWRLDPDAGADAQFDVNVNVDGFSIDNLSRFLFGGGGVQGNGLYRVALSQVGIGSADATFLGNGFGNNRRILALTNFSVLIQDGLEVRRFVESTPGTQAYFQWTPIPNTIPRIVSMTRRPFNQSGAGAYIGFNDFTTLCFCGTGFAFQGNNSVAGTGNPFAQEDYNGPMRGLEAIAGGLKQELYWYTDNPAGIATPGKTLYRIRQIPTAGSPGTLVVNLSLGQISFDLYGYPGEVMAVNMGGLPGDPPDLLEFIGPVGCVINPFAAGYFELLDGLGFFGPPNPFAVIPSSGVLTFGLSIPPIIPMNVFAQTQFYGFTPRSPNGLALISNTAAIGGP